MGLFSLDRHDLDLTIHERTVEALSLLPSVKKALLGQLPGSG